MAIERLIASHLRLGAEALAAARALATTGNRNAAYLAEQAVEQMLLALAQSEGLHLQRSHHHQLETVRRMLAEDGAFRDELSRLTWLESCATTYRYPRTLGAIPDPPAPKRLAEAIELAAILLPRIATHFGVDLDLAARSPASRIDPPKRS